MYRKYIKHTTDFIVAFIALILLALPAVIIAFWIKLDSKGPVIFKQKRYGKNKRPFTVYKFRSMSVHAPSDKATNDFHDSHSYITSAGKIMRKLSIDELPQLINVLKGNMSLIGPRPVVLSETRLIKLRDKYGANKLKPGITGWAQTNGRDELDDATKAEMDSYYTEHLGFMMDVKCIFKTVWVIIFAHGQAEGHEQVVQNNNKVSIGE
jgi:O-antigen biosynthesis protein WbqP